MKKQFDFQKLDVYQNSLDFIMLAAEIVEALPKGNAHLADQLQRASTSIALNIAEGAGEFSPPEKARFYRMARRSATEAAGLLDILERRSLGSQEVLDRGLDILWHVVNMLTRMVQNRMAGWRMEGERGRGERVGRGRGRGKGRG